MAVESDRQAYIDGPLPDWIRQELLKPDGLIEVVDLEEAARIVRAWGNLMAVESDVFARWLTAMGLSDEGAAAALEVSVEDIGQWKGELPPRHILLACSAYAAGLRPFS